MSAAIDYQLPTPEDEAVAIKSSRQLAAILGKGEESRLRLYDGHETYEVPTKAIRLLADILQAMSRGEAFSVIPIHKELTTQEAANFLNVSRPYLVGLLEAGEMPYHKTGVRRKVLFRDLLDYKARRDEESRQLLENLITEAQDLGMGY